MNETTVNEMTAVLEALRKKGVATLAEVQILLALMKAPEGIVVAALVKALEMPFSTASRVVWNLHDGLGLVSYKPHATDRRKKLVVLTPAAMKVLRPAVAKIGKAA